MSTQGKTMKAVDDRISQLIDRGVERKERSVVVMVGAKAKSRVPSLHEMLSKSCHKRPHVLWCYKRELGFASTHRKKRAKLLKKAAARGLTLDDDSLDQFMAHTNVRWCYYRDASSVLGSTFGTLVLQDFDGITPNILAQTIETVEGGGLVVLLMEALTSVESLYKAAAGTDADSSRRFMQRVLLLLLKDACRPNCIFLDDELNVLEIEKKKQTSFMSRAPSKIITAPTPTPSTLLQRKLTAKCKTPDQAQALIDFIEYLTDPTGIRVLALTSARGRGKSATIGLAVAAAFDLGYSSLCLVAPSAESVATIFHFVVTGLQALDYLQDVHFVATSAHGRQRPQQEAPVSGTASESQRGTGHMTIGIKIIKNKNGSSIRRGQQQLRYLWPEEARLAFAHTESKHQFLVPTTDLLILDEAAAMPLPLVKEIMGSYPTLLSSTVDGYEGTGRALQLKLLSEIKENNENSEHSTVKEIKLESPIRYASADPVERWLNIALCLDYYGNSTKLKAPLPLPADCALYQVNRDVLFSFHPMAEQVLHRMVSILSLAHYRSSPNDIEIMADAPAHRIFVLLAPVSEDGDSLPDILAVVHLAFEGGINTSDQGNKEGDLIPWTLAQQFCESAFPKLSGVRIVRIVTHPEARAMGYGTRILDLLIDYFQRGVSSQKEAIPTDTHESTSLFVPISQLKLHKGPTWIGASFGGTTRLLNFWGRAHFKPVYLRQTSSELTGEHTTILLRTLRGDDEWLNDFVQDARRRFISLASSPCFRQLELGFALAYLGHADSPFVGNKDDEDSQQLRVLRNQTHNLLSFFADRDLMRLEMYARNAIDHRVIADLAPLIASLVFGSKLQVHLSSLQAAVLFGFALQRRDIDDLSQSLTIPTNQVLALYNKAMRKISQSLQRMQKEAEAEHGDTEMTEAASSRENIEPPASDRSLRLTDTSSVVSRNKNKSSRKSI